MKPNRNCIWILSFILISFSTCSKATVMDTGSFSIYILKSYWQDLRLGYDLEQSWSILQEADLTKNIKVITAGDIQTYNWSSQTITLTQEASAYFNELPNEVKLEIENFKPAFVVVLNDHRLYGGLIIEGGTAMGTHYPVIYTNMRSNPVVFTIRPYLAPGLEYEQFDLSAKQIIENHEVYDLFDRLGKITR